MAKARTRRRDSAQSLGLKVESPPEQSSFICWTVGLLIGITPLALVPGLFLSHDVIPKVLLICFGAACLLFASRQWSRGLAGLSKSRNGKWFVWLLAAQALVLILSTILSSQPLLSFAGTTWRRFGLLEQLAILVIAAAAASCALLPHFTKTLWRAMIVCAGIASIYGIAQYFGIDPFLERKLYALDYLGGLVRPPATLGHSIYFAAYLAPLAVLAAWLTLEETSPSWRLLYGAVAILAPLAILLSGSRGSLLGYAGGLIVLAVYKRPSRRVIAICGVIVAAAGAFVAFAPAGDNLRHRIQQWKEDPGSVRMAVWKESPGLIALHPLLGSGPETFGNAFRQMESAALSRAYPDFINETPHNIFVDAACETGACGLLVLAGVFVFILLMTRSSAIRAAAVAALICGLFASFSLVSALFLWTLAAVAATEEETKAIRLPAFVPILATSAGIGFLAVAGILVVQDSAYAELQTKVEANDLPGSQRAELNATSFGLGLPGYELWSSQELAKLKDWNNAGEAATLAEKRGEDRAGAAYQSSILRIVAQDAAGAESKARDAIRYAPNWYKPHLLHAQILQAMGRSAEAADEAKLCLTLGWKGK